MKADAELVAATLQAAADFRWLDAKHSWFRLDSLPQYGLCNLILKALSGGRSNGDLHTAQGRFAVTAVSAADPPAKRAAGILPPHARSLCVGSESQVRAPIPRRIRRAVLGSVERIIVEALPGRARSWIASAFEEECSAAG